MFDFVRNRGPTSETTILMPPLNTSPGAHAAEFDPYNPKNFDLPNAELSPQHKNTDNRHPGSGPRFTQYASSLSFWLIFGGLFVSIAVAVGDHVFSMHINGERSDIGSQFWTTVVRNAFPKVTQVALGISSGCSITQIVSESMTASKRIF